MLGYFGRVVMGNTVDSNKDQGGIVLGVTDLEDKPTLKHTIGRTNNKLW